jgi:hypothetical protein
MVLWTPGVRPLVAGFPDPRPDGCCPHPAGLTGSWHTRRVLGRPPNGHCWPRISGVGARLVRNPRGPADAKHPCAVGSRASSVDSPGKSIIEVATPVRHKTSPGSSSMKAIAAKKQNAPERKSNACRILIARSCLIRRDHAGDFVVGDADGAVADPVVRSTYASRRCNGPAVMGAQLGFVVCQRTSNMRCSGDSRGTDRRRLRLAGQAPEARRGPVRG